MRPKSDVKHITMQLYMTTKDLLCKKKRKNETNCNKLKQNQALLDTVVFRNFERI